MVFQKVRRRGSVRWLCARSPSLRRARPTARQVLLIDGAGHLLGRLASTIAKELLSGQRVVVVRCEKLNISGSIFRSKMKYAAFLRKRTNTNHARGPFHLRAPSRMFWRTVRGMLPHKTSRGAAALSRLKVFEGIPPPYDKRKRFVVPCALRVLRLRPDRRFCTLGHLASSVGWRFEEIVKKLEEKRTIKAKAFYERKKELVRMRAKAAANAAPGLESTNQQLAALGY